MKKKITDKPVEYTIDLAHIMAHVFSDNKEAQDVIEQRIRSNGISIESTKNGLVKFSLK